MMTVLELDILLKKIFLTQTETEFVENLLDYYRKEDFSYCYIMINSGADARSYQIRLLDFELLM
jgi:hypothetical protein